MCSSSQLRGLVDKTRREMLVEQHAVSAFRARLSSALALTVFLSRLHAVESVAQLSSLVHDGLPTVLGVRSAALLLSQRYLVPLSGKNVVAAAGAAITSEDGLRFVTPKENTELHVQGKDDDNTFVSFRRLSTIPVFGSDVRDDREQSKLLLYSTDADDEASSGVIVTAGKDDGNPLPFGGIITHGSQTAASEESSSSADGGGPGDRPWSGLEDVLLKGLGENIHAVLKSLRRRERMSLVSKESDQYRSNLEEATTAISQLEEQLGHESALKKEFEAGRDALQTQLESAQREIQGWERTVSDHVETRREIESDRDTQVERLQEKLALTEASSHLSRRLRDGRTRVSTTAARVLSYDQRCHRETVIQWLDELFRQYAR